MDYSINYVAERLHQKLAEYIETQYPISEKSFQIKRTELLNKPGVLSTEPYIEATPVYEVGSNYRNMDIPEVAQNLMVELANFVPSVGVFPKPYLHQEMAMQAFLQQNKDIIVSTGTGSGKTESFLHPVLNTLYQEAKKRPEQFKKRAVRALVLYPMNALVSDQMTRLRRLFGDDRVKKIFQDAGGRNTQFGMYTSRTPYAGAHSATKDRYQLDDILKYYSSLEKNKPAEVKQMKERGKWPAKDLTAFKNSKETKRDLYRGIKTDAELFTRHEMQDTPPDILVTNYSMLEYMLMRPIERSIWEQTKEWLESNEDNYFVLVLDEAHMYRGTGGAEVALLIRRLQSRLGIDRNRLKCILTSASLGKENDDVGPIEFAKQLTGTPSCREFKLIRGVEESRIISKASSEQDLGNLSSMDSDAFISIAKDYPSNLKKLNPFFSKLMWPSPPEEREKFPQYLYEQLNGWEPLEKVVKQISGSATTLKAIVSSLYPSANRKEAEKAISNLLLLANAAKKNGRVLLPARVHIFFRGLSGIYSCINPMCTGCNEDGLLGKLFEDFRVTCDCGARVYEVMTHRYCGSAFIKGYIKEKGVGQAYLWNEGGHGVVDEKLKEIHLLVEKPHEEAIKGNGITPLWLHIETGYLQDTPPSTAGFIQVYKSVEKVSRRKHKNYYSNAISFERCPCCLKSAKFNIRDLRIKGEQPFANLIREQFRIQPPVEGNNNINEGRKVLIFSDGRQKAARLARDIPEEVEKDSIRQLILKAAFDLEKEGIRAKIGKELYPAVLHYLHTNQLHLFSQEKRKDLVQDKDYYVREFYEEYGPDLIEIFNEADDDLDMSLRKEFKLRMLEVIGSPGYSIYDTTTGIVVPIKRVYSKDLRNLIVQKDFENISILFIKELLDNIAVDIDLEPYERRDLLGLYRDESEWGRNFHSISKQLKINISKCVGEENTETLIQLLFKKLCRTKNDKYFLDLNKLTIKDGIHHTWYKCTSCKQIHAVKIQDNCPSCNDNSIEELLPNSDILRAEKGYWRTPIAQVLAGEKITNISVEEHTAQLSQKDPSVAFATTEQYEMAFQDIVLDEDLGIVDILSCTTTMEVGIDIGSLTAVGMRNIPPQRENYQQRAGRAGRRGSSLSTVITYAQDGPHDHHYFNHPEYIISGENREALIYITNKKIIKRHIHALLIQTYFHNYADDETISSSISEALGSTLDFFKGKSTFSIDAFYDWVQKQLKLKFVNYPEVFAIIPEEAVKNESEKWGLIKEAAENLDQDLVDAFDEVEESINKYFEILEGEDDIQSEKHPDELLLNFLFNHGFLPTYAFPRNLSNFYIQGRNNKNKVILEQRPQLELNRALSEYAPGRQVVVNKKTYRIGGIYNPFSKNPDAPAQDINIYEKRVAFCLKCNFTKKLEDNKLHEVCPNCKENILIRPYVRPTGFSPEKGRELQKGDLSQEYSYTSTPQLIIDKEDFKPSPYNKLGLIKYMHRENEELIIVNRGADNESGFWMCEDCGFIKPVLGNEDLSKGHDKPFQQSGMVERKCSGSLHQIYLGNSFRTDLFLIRLTMDEKLDFYASKKWLHDALNTLGEGLVLASSRILDIDAQELTVGYRILQEEQGIGFVDLYLFDTLSGGAGYSYEAGNRITEIIEKTFDVLNECANNCDSSCYKCLRNYQNQMKHGQLNRMLGLELLTYLVSGHLKVYTSEQEIGVLKKLKATYDLHHGQGYAKFKSVNNHEFLELVNGKVIGLKNNIEKKYTVGDIQFYSPYEINFDLPNVYEEIEQ
ncbi:DEAD/DEAH box helicase [Sporosarcina highlanderae]|uniref:DEAD/DEAH box helicase n=1 Tax=Sporosarcina highlanderae TaxID=3035916 RepID=A0ABT8JQ69_9BACL|nr:DEAD/DEAH box helicase [Sporosarcina highlanderae]MDN4607167.1 DEAD/DEAH box helicase [Sporosarcina highlanderae]